MRELRHAEPMIPRVEQRDEDVELADRESVCVTQRDVERSEHAATGEQESLPRCDLVVAKEFRLAMRSCAVRHAINILSYESKIKPHLLTFGAAMFAQIVTFEETPEQIDAGIQHVVDDVLPALETAEGLTGLWLVDREHGRRVSVLMWESEAAAALAMARVQQRVAASKHTRPTPSSIQKFDVYARTARTAPAEQVIRSVMSAIESANWGRARALLADDFVFSGPVPRPIDRDSWLGVHQALYSAMPDLRFNASDFADRPAGATFGVSLTMTHTGTLDLPPLGIHGAIGTGKKVALPAESCAVTVQDGQLTSWTNVTPPNGWLIGIASQLGLAVAQ